MLPDTVPGPEGSWTVWSKLFRMQWSSGLQRSSRTRTESEYAAAEWFSVLRVLVLGDKPQNVRGEDVTITQRKTAEDYRNRVTRLARGWKHAIALAYAGYGPDDFDEDRFGVFMVKQADLVPAGYMLLGHTDDNPIGDKTVALNNEALLAIYNAAKPTSTRNIRASCDAFDTAQGGRRANARGGFKFWDAIATMAQLMSEATTVLANGNTMTDGSKLPVTDDPVRIGNIDAAIKMLTIIHDASLVKAKQAADAAAAKHDTDEAAA